VPRVVHPAHPGHLRDIAAPALAIHVHHQVDRVSRLLAHRAQRHALADGEIGQAHQRALRRVAVDCGHRPHAQVACAQEFARLVMHGDLAQHHHVRPGAREQAVDRLRQCDAVLPLPHEGRHDHARGGRLAHVELAKRLRHGQHDVGRQLGQQGVEEGRLAGREGARYQDAGRVGAQDGAQHRDQAGVHGRCAEGAQGSQFAQIETAHLPAPDVDDCPLGRQRRRQRGETLPAGEIHQHDRILRREHATGARVGDIGGHPVEVLVRRELAERLDAAAALDEHQAFGPHHDLFHTGILQQRLQHAHADQHAGEPAGDLRDIGLCPRPRQDAGQNAGDTRSKGGKGGRILPARDLEAAFDDGGLHLRQKVVVVVELRSHPATSSSSAPPPVSRTASQG